MPNEKYDVELHWLVYVLVVVLTIALLKYIFTFPALEIVEYKNCTINNPPSYYIPYMNNYQQETNTLCNNCSNPTCHCVWMKRI